jgi:hypothetical protein
MSLSTAHLADKGEVLPFVQARMHYSLRLTFMSCICLLCCFTGRDCQWQEACWQAQGLRWVLLVTGCSLSSLAGTSVDPHFAVHPP